ncbi:MAG: glycosyltransferase family 2 protein [Proteobacteria bacterium]|nr:glycosyltransferase family 2 protein [Pseudomonadota bacterium]
MPIPKPHTRPTVSVIIPTYNRSSYVIEAIESVLAQTYKNIEIVIIDDGSTDDTRERLKPYLNQYKDRIKYIYTENGGPARARNIGMKAATGEYIAFLDSDDLYYPFKTELQVGVLENNPDVALVCSDLSAVNDTKILDEFHLKNYHKEAYADIDSTYDNIYSSSMSITKAGLSCTSIPKDWTKGWNDRKVYVGDVFDRYYDDLILSTNTVMFRKSSLEHVGLQHEPYSLFEDYEFVLRITKSYRVAFIDVPTYKLRYHANQISSARKKPNGTEILIQKHNNLIEIAEKHGLNDVQYYSRNKAVVDKKLSGLNRSLAIMLMTKTKNSKRAREHLKSCAAHNRPEYRLWLLTHAPQLLRRAGFKMGKLLDMIQ